MRWDSWNDLMRNFVNFFFKSNDKSDKILKIIIQDFGKFVLSKL